MSWVLLTILAAFLWGTVSIVDKFVMSKWTKTAMLPVLFLGFAGLVASILIFAFYPVGHLSPANIALAIGGGVLYFLGATLFFEAAKLEEISRIISVMYIQPLFVLFLATFFLGERFTAQNYLGILLLVAGSLLISVKKDLKLRSKKVAGLIFLSTFLYGCFDIITKYALGFADVWTVFAYMRIGLFLPTLIVLYRCLPEIKSLIRNHGKKTVVVLTLNSVISLVAYVLLTLAFTAGTVSLVNALSSLQPLFVLVIAILVSQFFPRLLNEKTNKTTIALKFIAAIIMVIGALMVTN